MILGKSCRVRCLGCTIIHSFVALSTSTSAAVESVAIKPTKTDYQLSFFTTTTYNTHQSDHPHSLIMSPCFYKN